MIKVQFEAALSVSTIVELSMTEDEFEQLSYHEQMKLLESKVDWHEELRSADLEDIDVLDVWEVSK